MAEQPKRLEDYGAKPAVAARVDTRPDAPPTGAITRDTLGRPLITVEERRRAQALELSVATYKSHQGLGSGQTALIISRAKKFEEYIEIG